MPCLEGRVSDALKKDGKKACLKGRVSDMSQGMLKKPRL